MNDGLWHLAVYDKNDTLLKEGVYKTHRGAVQAGNLYLRKHLWPDGYGWKVSKVQG